MRVRLPIIFTAQTVKKGHRTPNAERFVQHVDLEIPVIDPSDAPVAVKGFDVQGHGGIGYTRWHDGSHWFPEMSNANLLNPEQWCALALGNDSSKSWLEFGKANYGQYALDKFKKIGLPPLVPEDYRRVEGSDLDGRIAQVQDFVRQFGVIDGVVHRRVETPVYAMYPRRNWYEAEVIFGFHAGSGVDFFCLDRRADMDQHATLLNPDMDREFGSEPELLIPGVLDAPDEEITLSRRGRQILMDTKPYLSNMDEELGVAWFRVKGALDRFRAALQDKESVQQRGNEVAGCLLEFASYISDADPDSADSPGIIVVKAKAAAEQVATRWSLRPMELEPAGMSM